jgi:hypothetical protein
MLLGGAIIWAAYSAINLLVNGAVLDEVIVPAQIITGSVRYPAGHPHEIYYTRIFTLPNYLAAGLWAAIPDVLLLSTLRNFLLLFLSAFLPFGFAILFTRQPIWGHVAATLTVAQVGGVPFSGIYPVSVFPTFYSTGQIGLQIALLSGLLLLSGHSKLAGFAFGLLPGIHGTIGLLVWLWGGVYMLLTRGKGFKLNKLQFVAAAGLGILVCAILFGVIRLRAVDDRIEPPYDVQADGEIIYEQFTENSDEMRQPFPLASLGYLINPGAFFLLASWLFWRARRQRQTTRSPDDQTLLALLLLGGLVWVYVYGTRLFQGFGGVLPTFVQVSMPARFSNVTALLLMPLTVAVIAHRQSDMPKRSAPAARTLVIVMVLLAAVVPTMAQGRFAPELTFVVWGSLVAMELFARPVVDRWALSIALSAIIVGVVLVQLGKIMFLASFLVSAGILGFAARMTKARESIHQHWPRWIAFGLVVACLFASSAALLAYSAVVGTPKVLKITQEDRELEAWLRANSKPTDMILTPYNSKPELQIKTGHPVLMEWITHWLISYMPSLAPVIGMMTRDLYGIDYSDPASINRFKRQDCSEFWVKLCKDAYVDAWRTRTLADWQGLAKKYRFHLVFSHSEMPLQLPAARSWPSGWTLYVIPHEND